MPQIAAWSDGAVLEQRLEGNGSEAIASTFMLAAPKSFMNLSGAYW